MRNLGLAAVSCALMAWSAAPAVANCASEGRYKSGGTSCVLESIGGRAALALAVCSPDGSWRPMRGSSEETRVWCPCEYNGARFTSGAVLAMGDLSQKFRCVQGLWWQLEERGPEAAAAAGASQMRTGTPR